MKKKLLRILSILLCFCLVFEQSAFAQVAAQLDIAGHLSALRSSFIQDKFRPPHLRYLSYDSLNNNFKLFLDKGDLNNPKPAEMENVSKDLLKYFFIGLTLPNDSFWVNLRPDAEDNIIDGYLVQTEVGKIMLEADLQLKKDTAQATSPETPEGKEYWDKLYKKAGEIFGSENITIPTLTRPWIVPDEIIIRETADSAYIYKATLKVMLEQDYLKDSAVYNFEDKRSKELNEYSSQLIRELIIPKLTKEINTSKKYASLRQIYYSLILAQWFKARYANKDTAYSRLINRKDLTNLSSKEPWSKTTYFKQYQRSFKDGEYNISEPVYTPLGQTIKSYFSGGMIATSSNLDLALRSPTAKAGNVVVEPAVDDFHAGGKPYLAAMRAQVTNNLGEIQRMQSTSLPAVGSSPMNNHPELGSYDYDSTGERWMQDGGAGTIYVSGPDELPNFRIGDYVKNRNKTPQEMIGLLTPLDSDMLRFSNHDAVVDFTGDSELKAYPANVNTDLQMQRRIGQMLKERFIDGNTFVLISHGHFLAGVAFFAQAKDEEGNYLFDVSVYFPRGNWSKDTSNISGALDMQYQLWSESFQKRKQSGQKTAKGKVVALFGHRGRMDYSGGFGTAHINPNTLFGTPEEFARFLKENNLNKVVIITEEHSADINKVYEIPLSRLKDGIFGEENKDIYPYMEELSKLIPVKVTAGDMRPVPAGHYLANKLAEEDRQYFGIENKGESNLNKPSSDSPAVGSSAISDKGGIDFRSLPIITQAISNLSLNTSRIHLNRLNSVNLNQEWQEIQKMVKAGIKPSTERIKEHIQLSCLKGEFNDIYKIISCIVDMLRDEEERCSPAEPILKDILVVLESGRSIQELKVVFIGNQP